MVERGETVEVPGLRIETLMGLGAKAWAPGLACLLVREYFCVVHDLSAYHCQHGFSLWQIWRGDRENVL